MFYQKIYAQTIVLKEKNTMYTSELHKCCFFSSQNILHPLDTQSSKLDRKRRVETVSLYGQFHMVLINVYAINSSMYQKYIDCSQ